jgi:hypothetical protein
MTPDSITMRFPTGAWEFGFMAKAPQLGDTVVRQGVTWEIVDIVDTGDEHHDVTMARVLPTEGELSSPAS